MRVQGALLLLALVVLLVLVALFIANSGGEAFVGWLYPAGHYAQGGSIPDGPM